MVCLVVSVMRTQGCLRVVLNSKIWAGMLIEMANSKSVRFTAIDGDEGVKVFLVLVSVNLLLIKHIIEF